MFAIYGKKQSTVFKEDVRILSKSFQRRRIEEKQGRDGQIQTGESPISSFNLCRMINEYMLSEQTTE